MNQASTALTDTSAIDPLIRKHTAARSLADLTDNMRRDYFPTLIPTGKHAAEICQIADAYDREMIRRGDPRRAWRGLPRLCIVSRRADQATALNL